MNLLNTAELGSVFYVKQQQQQKPMVKFSGFVDKQCSILSLLFMQLVKTTDLVN